MKIGNYFLMIFVVVLFRELNNSSVISSLFKAVGYTYGPLLGLFTFGLTTKYQVREKYLPWVCLLSPVISYVVNCYSEQLLFGYKFGFEILLFNGLLCYLGLLLIRDKRRWSISVNTSRVWVKKTTSFFLFL